MKQEEVPQDKSNLSQNNMRELCYATDGDGNYKTVLSEGWEPKTIALSNSIQDIEERVEEAKQNVIAERISPIAYFMELHRMDVQTLSSYVGMWKWRVKRHFKPRIFKKLNNTILGKYAETFEISVDILKNYKGE